MKLDELPLQELSVSEKLRAMQLLWVDLSRTAADQAVPAWHADVLAAREQRLAAGKEKVLNWDEAKAELRQRIHDAQNS